MNYEIIDLSNTFESGVPFHDVNEPSYNEPHIRYINHNDSTERMLSFFPGLTKKELPDQMAWASEKVELSSHSCTHLDAPYHYYPTMNNGKRSLTIDEIPLEWCFADGVLLDFTMGL